MEIDTRRKIGGSMPKGAHAASHSAPAIQTGQTGKCNQGGRTPATPAMSAVNSFSVVTSGPDDRKH
jgi:hypothetical protein